MKEQKQKEVVEEEDTLGDVQTCKKGSDLKEGTHVHRYIILGLIGKGGMGAVYKAYDPELDRNIALKILSLSPQEGETNSVPQARLMREAQALAKLNHPNVVSVFDVGTHEDGVYIAMEYVEGKTLREWIKQDEPNQQKIIEVMLAAGRGLHAAHTEGIVHRDFKPENLIVGNTGQVRVLDFGLARAADFENLPIRKKSLPEQLDSQSQEQFLSQPLTQVGILIGTMAYMAPEHFLYQELDEKTDQFSFCLTLFESLFGQRPFSGKTKTALEDNVTQGRIQVPKGVNVSDWLKNIVLKGLSVSKEDRYQSMAQLLDDLGYDPELARLQKRRKQLFVLSFVLATVFLLGFGYVFFQRSEVCTGADLKIARVWSNADQKKVKESFIQTGLSYADETWTRVKKSLDSHLVRWANEYTETCEATRVRGEQSEDHMALKLDCLDRYLRNMQALVKVLIQADQTVVAEIGSGFVLHV